MPDVAEAEAVGNVEGDMCGAARRGAVAPPGSKTTSRRNGTRRNLGDLRPPAAAVAVPGLGGKLDRAEPLRKAGGVGRLRSTDEASNKADPGSAAEMVEGRRPVGGEGEPRRMSRTRCRNRHVPETASLPTGTGGAAQAPTPVAFDLRQEPGAGKPHAGICAGGGPQGPSLPRPATLG
jgi:hypothetical protein